MSLIFNLGLDLIASADQFEGIDTVNKFGQNPDIDTATDPEDIWDGGGIWVPPTQARVHDIASSSSDDDGDPAGTGAHKVMVYGLNENWALVDEEVTLNGTTNVATVNSYVIIHRMIVTAAGTGGENAGDITATAQTDSTVTAQITAGNNQTLMAIYGVPVGYTAFLTNYYASSNRLTATAGAMVDIKLMSKPDADLATSVYQLKHITGLTLEGSSLVRHDFHPFNKFTGKTIIKIQAADVTDNDTDVSAGFDLVLIKNERLNDLAQKSYLTSI